MARELARLTDRAARQARPRRIESDDWSGPAHFRWPPKETLAFEDIASMAGSGLRDRDQDPLAVLVGDEHGLEAAAKGSGVGLERGESQVVPSLEF